MLTKERLQLVVDGTNVDLELTAPRRGVLALRTMVIPYLVVNGYMYPLIWRIGAALGLRNLFQMCPGGVLNDMGHELPPLIKQVIRERVPSRYLAFSEL